jgi:hypothetical protein
MGSAGAGGTEVSPIDVSSSPSLPAWPMWSSVPWMPCGHGHGTVHWGGECWLCGLVCVCCEISLEFLQVVVTVSQAIKSNRFDDPVCRRCAAQHTHTANCNSELWISLPLIRDTGKG